MTQVLFISKLTLVRTHTVIFKAFNRLQNQQYAVLKSTITFVLQETMTTTDPASTSTITTCPATACPK